VAGLDPVSFSCRRPGTVLAFFAVVAVAMGFAARNLELDALPDVTGNQVVVLTRAPGLSPLEIEMQVTQVVELATSALPGVASQRSTSRYGISSVTLVFDDSMGPLEARQAVLEKISALGPALPAGIPLPELGPLTGGLGEIFQFTLSSPVHSGADLLEMAVYDLGPVFRSIPGVVEFNPWGGKERTLDLVVDPNRLARFGLTLVDLKSVLRDAIRVAPGAAIETDGAGQVYVRGIQRPETPAALGEVLLRPARRSGDGIDRGESTGPPERLPVRIRDVAQVREGHRVRLGAATRDGEGETLYVMLQMLRGDNALEVARKVNERLDEARALLPEDVKLTVAYDRSELVLATVRTVTENLVLGGLLVVGVLFLLLGSFRAGLLVALVIPFSMLGALAGMVALGIPGNLMSLGAIDFGLLVDGAVVTVESFFERRESNAASWTERIRQSASQVAGPVAISVAIIILVYAPILLLTGVDGALFRPMAITVVLALATALVLAATVVPAASVVMLRPKDLPEKEPWLARQIRRGYEPLLDRCLAHTGWVALGGLALLALGVALFSRTEMAFVPQLDEGDLVIQTQRTPNISLDGAIRGATRLENAIMPLPEVRHVASRIGSPAVATDIMGLEQADVFVDLAPKKDWRPGLTKPELIERIEARIRTVDPAANPSFTQPIQMRFNELLEGETADVTVSIFGPDLLRLRTEAERLARTLRDVPGAADVRITAPPEVETLQIRPRPLMAAQLGVESDEILTTVEAMESGVEVARTYRGRVPVPVRIRVRGAGAATSVPQQPVATPSGELVPLERLAQVKREATPSLIAHENGTRRIVIGFNVRERSLGAVVTEAQERLETDLPAGYRMSWGGQFESLEQARARLRTVAPLALAAIVGLLLFLFKSVRPAAYVLSNVPVAAVGGLVALNVRGLPLSISAIVGFIALSGIAVLNGVVLFSRIQQLERDGFGSPRRIGETAAQNRLRPVLMTALTDAIGFLPMMLATGVGAEVQRPLATVVVGGLFTSTLLTLFILPAVYVGLESRRARR
jgi:cobalt-zinc-cadmium resistance protein CzcA